MKINHLHLNTSILKSPKEVFEFIVSNNIDVACLNEIVYPINGENPLKSLAEEAGYYYCEGINFFYKPNNQVIAEAIISKFPIIDYSITYYNSDDFNPKEIDSKDVLGELILDSASINFPGSRGIKHAVKSRCVLNCILDTGDSLLRTVTAHYSVSDLCTETIQMLQMSKLINSLIKYSKDLAVIFSADLNIRAKSYSVAVLEEVMTCHTKDSKDTLANHHEAKKKDFPEGLAIDHVFSKNINHLSTKTIDIEFADHKAIISEFEI